ncbi:universal stress protein [Flexivirga sp.]|uniref:universal stress protein n=1 Tax=Flexivirga sp. TaxID=1962927 RepID=UPI003F81B97F
MPTEHHSRVIVVGVDGSAGSLRAMRWAIDEAALRDCAIEAVTVWRTGSNGVGTRHAAEELQARVVQQACAGLADSPLVCEEIETGNPEEVLVTRSEHASLLVIGSHGVGSVRHAALGSTSEYCSRMAACPVVVLPMPADGGRHTQLAER